MSEPTPVTEEETPEVTPPSEEADQPSEETEETEPTESVESLKEQLAATEAEKEKAEEEARRWKGRVKEENPPKKKEEKEEDYADWRIDNKERIALVKEEYEKELDELEQAGVKLTNAMREKALIIAESKAGVKKKEEETEPIPEGTVDRTGDKEPQMTEHDVAFGIKPETVKKWGSTIKEITQ